MHCQFLRSVHHSQLRQDPQITSCLMRLQIKPTVVENVWLDCAASYSSQLLSQLRGHYRLEQIAKLYKLHGKKCIQADAKHQVWGFSWSYIWLHHHAWYLWHLIVCLNIWWMWCRSSSSKILNRCLLLMTKQRPSQLLLCVFNVSISPIPFFSFFIPHSPYLSMKTT